MLHTEGKAVSYETPKMNEYEKLVYQSLLDKHQVHLISLPAASKELGLAVQTGYNLNHRNEFPVPVVRVSRKPLVRITDLASYLTGSSAKDEKKRGRPAKALQIAKS